MKTLYLLLLKFKHKAIEDEYTLFRKGKNVIIRISTLHK